MKITEIKTTLKIYNPESRYENGDYECQHTAESDGLIPIIIGLENWMTENIPDGSNRPSFEILEDGEKVSDDEISSVAESVIWDDKKKEWVEI